MRLTKAQHLAVRALQRAPNNVLWGATSRQSDTNLNGTTAGHLIKKGLVQLAPVYCGLQLAYTLTEKGKNYDTTP